MLNPGTTSRWRNHPANLCSSPTHPKTQSKPSAHSPPLTLTSLEGKPQEKRRVRQGPPKGDRLGGPSMPFVSSFQEPKPGKAKWSKVSFSICCAGIALEVTAGDRGPRWAPSAFSWLPHLCPLGPLTFYSVFLSLKMDRELGAAVQERACSPLQLHRGCNTIVPAPYPHRYLFIHTAFLLVFIKLGRKG